MRSAAGVTVKSWIVSAVTTCLALCAAAPGTGVANAADVAPFTVTPPTVSGPIPTTQASYPFAADGFKPQFPLPRGYEVREYFVSGSANIYEFTSTGIRVVAPCPASVTGAERPSCSGLPYTTRLLVYAPTNPRRFSGSVWVNPMNPTFNLDIPVIWDRNFDYGTQGTRDNSYFAREGDIVVQWTSKSVAVDYLKRWDPARYSPLSWPYDPAQPGGNNAPYDGITYDVASQIGALVHIDGRQSPLRAYDVRHVFETGYSQDGGFTFNQANVFHQLTRLPNRKPVYDGYVAQANGGTGGSPLFSLNFGLTSAGSLGAGDPRVKMAPRSAPVIKLNTETELDGLFGGVTWRRPDSDAPNDRYREWEVGGASHDDVGDLFSPTYLEAYGVPFYDYAGCDHVGIAGITSPTNYPYNYVANAAYAALKRWVTSGTPPARVPRLQQTDLVQPTKDTMQRDAVGNPLGGVRTPLLDVPIATYNVFDGPASAGCTLNGWIQPFDAGTLARLYPSHGAYVSKFVHAANAAVRDGVWLREDARVAIAKAAGSNVP
jgi:hypothetical protein